MLIFGGAYITRQDSSFLVFGSAYFIAQEAPTGATVKVYSGTAWNTHPLKVYDGASFVQAKDIVTY